MATRYGGTDLPQYGGKRFSHRSPGPWDRLAGNPMPASNSKSCSEGIGQELMGECVGLSRGRFVPGSNSRDIRALIGIGVQNL